MGLSGLGILALRALLGLTFPKLGARSNCPASLVFFWLGSHLDAFNQVELLLFRLAHKGRASDYSAELTGGLVFASARRLLGLYRLPSARLSNFAAMFRPWWNSIG